jgi:hypothetical protein
MVEQLLWLQQVELTLVVAVAVQDLIILQVLAVQVLFLFATPAQFNISLVAQ